MSGNTPASPGAPPPRLTARERAAVQATLRTQLDLAVADGRLVGVLFVVLGGLGTLIAVTYGRTSGQTNGPALAAASGGLLLGPGVLYLIGAASLRRARASAGVLAMRASLAHATAIVATLAVVAAGGGVGRGVEWRIVGLPAGIGLFFLPALLALAWHLRRATAAARVLDEDVRAFEPVFASSDAPVAPRPVVPVGDDE